MYKDINRAFIFENLVCGFECEFYSPFARKSLAEMLSKELGKKVHALNTHDPGFPLSESTFKIEPDFSGGMKMHELVTGKLPYYEAIHVLYKIYNFIDEYCYTSDRCGVHVNLSINEKALGLKTKMEQMNTFKFIIGLDEQKIFDIWPSYQQSKIQKVYKNPISFIYPKNRFISETYNPATMTSSADFAMPQSKYYGINFEKLRQGYIEVRYAGGIEYQKKKNQTTALINLIGEHLYYTLLNNKTYSPEELAKINKIVIDHKTIATKMRTYENMRRNFPQMIFLADMKENHELLRTRYLEIRDRFTDFVNFTGIKECVVNYDSARKRLQIKGAKIKSSTVLEGIDFFECSIESELKDCFIYESKVTSSLMTECYISNYNTIKYSFLDHCRYDASGNSSIKYSYLKNEAISPVAAQLTECIINKGVLSQNSVVDNKTELIQVEKGSSKIINPR